MNEVLGPLTPAQQEVVDTIEEIYGCNRMMLAALPKELLAAVCSGNSCDMYEVRAGGMGDETWDSTQKEAFLCLLLVADQPHAAGAGEHKDENLHPQALVDSTLGW